MAELLTPTEKARRITVPFGDILLNGFVLPDGSYALSQSQVAEVLGMTEGATRKFLTRTNLIQNQSDALPGKDFRLVPFSIEVERDSLSRGGANTVKIIPVRLASAFWLQQACKGNDKAQALAATCMEEALERRFDKIVGIEKLEDYYNERLTTSREWFQSRQFERDMHTLFQAKCIAIRVHAGVAHDMLTRAITGCTAEEHRMLEFCEDNPRIGLNHIKNPAIHMRIAYAKLMFARTKSGTLEEKIEKAVSKTYRAGY